MKKSIKDILKLPHKYLRAIQILDKRHCIHEVDYLKNSPLIIKYTDTAMEESTNQLRKRKESFMEATDHIAYLVVDFDNDFFITRYISLPYENYICKKVYRKNEDIIIQMMNKKSNKIEEFIYSKELPLLSQKVGE